VNLGSGYPTIRGWATIQNQRYFYDGVGGHWPTKLNW
jgi:hypothetical protein